MLARVAKPLASGVAGAVGLGAVALWVDAPQPDMGDGSYDTQKREPRFPEWVHDLGRVPIFAGATLASKVYLQLLNNTEVQGAELLFQQLDSRPEGTTVITVSNHSATVDDPAVIANMMPWKYAWPRNGRWSVASQEYCYTKGRFLSAVFFGAKTLPIKRGAGIDHKMFADLFEKVEEGTWVHLFPEGKICQYEALGGRPSPRREEIGRLKWGVGKVIARATQRPVVVPIYHYNMEKLMPQDRNNRLISMIPGTNLDLGVVVGEPISFDDLFEQFAAGRVVGSSPWESQEREKALYSAITRRIEEALLALAKQTPAVHLQPPTDAQ